MGVKVGDVVHVRGVVASAFGPRIVFNGCEMSDHANSIWIELGTIVHVEPRPLRVGDRVLHKDRQRGVLKAIDGDYAWIWVDNLGPQTVKFADLHRSEA